MKKIKKKENRLIIVANRLPVRRVQNGNHRIWESSPGGLVSALSPFLRKHSGIWIGWPGFHYKSSRSFTVNGIRQQPVSINSRELNGFYYGFCNATLWPLYHDSICVPAYHRHWWKPYVEINKRFADACLKHVRSEKETIWVHDYQLQLVPHYLKEASPNLRIGFFLHIPFPPVELFGHLPWRTQIIEGILGSDLIGFQTKASLNNFKEAAEKYAKAKTIGNEIRFRGRRILIKDFPITIDVDRYEQAARNPKVIQKTKDLKKRLDHRRKIILGVDRLDYTKGIDRRFKAFETLLEQNRIKFEEFVYIQVAVPSREKVASYIELKNEIEQMVGHLNGEYAVTGMVPFQYLHRSLQFEELIAYYKAADIMLVTPLKDGMNLVSKEYVCTRIDNTGSLILSEFAGAANELKDAFLVNPYDIDGLADCIETAFRSSETELKVRMKKLRQVVKARNVHQWANSFLQLLQA